MSKKFYAVNRETGDRWTAEKNHDNQFLMMYDSGYLAILTQDWYWDITPLDPKVWKTVIKDNLKTR